MPHDPKSFARSFRRAIHLAVLLDMAMEYLTHEPDTTSQIAAKAIDVCNATKKFRTVCERAAPVAWQRVKEDLESEHIDYLMEILDEVEDGVNVDDLIEAIRNCKKKAA